MKENKNGELDICSKKRRNSRRSICRCPVCKKYYLRAYTEKSHLIQCISQKDNLTEEFYKSDFRKLKIDYDTVETLSVKKLLTDNDYKVKYKNKPGVWALWKDGKCVQVAKTQDIYGEIYNDFVNKKGSLDYSEYGENGQIVIVSDQGSSFEIEAKYAYDNKATHWGINRRKDRNGNMSEWARIKSLLNTTYFDIVES